MPMAYDLFIIAMVLLYEGFWVAFGSAAYTKTPGRRMLRFLLAGLLSGLPGFIVGLFIGRHRARKAAIAEPLSPAGMEPVR